MAKLLRYLIDEERRDAHKYESDRCHRKAQERVGKTGNTLETMSLIEIRVIYVPVIATITPGGQHGAATQESSTSQGPCS